MLSRGRDELLAERVPERVDGNPSGKYCNLYRKTGREKRKRYGLVH